MDFATIKINPTSDYIHIENEQASFVLDGIKTSIASDAFETYITLINTKYPIGNELDSITRKQMAKELGEFFEKDDGKVSAQSLEKWSKETGLRILDKEPEAARYELTVELFQNNKSIAKTITDASGNFTIKSIPDGEYGLKVTNPTGETPEYFLMTIGGIGTIICCCPGPPCEDPILLYFGTITESKNKTLLVKNNEITATLSYINFKITKGYEK